MKTLGVALSLSAVVLLSVGCSKKEEGAAKAGGSATTCDAGMTEGPGEGFCIKLPAGFKFEDSKNGTTKFVNATYDRVSIEHTKGEYQFKNTPEAFKAMTANKTPTASGLLLGGKGGWALLDDGQVATATVRINHPKGGMLEWSLSSDSKSGKVKNLLETAKTITLLGP